MKIRRFWTRNPVTKIKESKKKYDRKLTKRQIKQILKSEDL